METSDPKNNNGGGSTNRVGAKPGHAARIMASAPDEQIEAALGASKFERAADLVERHGERLLADGAEAQLLDWFERIPDALVRKSPRLGVLHAWLLVYVERYQSAASRLSEAERALRTLEMSGAHGWPEDDDDDVALEPFADLNRGIRAVRAHLAWIQGDLSRLPHAVEEAMLPASADHPVWRARALVTLGRCHFLAGSLTEAQEDLEAALACTLASGQRRSRVIAHEARVVLGRVHEAAGRLDAAQALYDELVRATGDATEHADEVAAARVGLGRIALARFDLEAASRALSAGLARADATTAQAVALDGLIALAWLEQASGGPAAARDALDRAERFLKAGNRGWPQEIVSAHRARLAVARGDGPGAKRWAQQFALRGADRLGPIRELQLVTYGLALLAAGDAEAAAAPLAEARAAAAAGGHRLMEIEAAVAEARVWFARGKTKEAGQALAEALALAAPIGVVSPFVTDGPLPAPLLEGLAKSRRDSDKALVDAVLAASAHGRPETPSKPKPKPVATRAKPAETRAEPIATNQPVVTPPSSELTPTDAPADETTDEASPESPSPSAPAAAEAEATAETGARGEPITEVAPS